MNLGDYLALLRRRFWWIVAVVVVVVVSVIVMTSRQTPIYEARAEVLLEPLGQGATEVPGVGASVRDMPTHLRLALSVPVADAVIERLELEADPVALLDHVQARQLRDTAAIEILARHPDPEFAASLAQTFVEEYLEIRRSHATERLVASTSRLRQEAEGLRSRILSIEAEIAEIETDDDGATATEGEAQTRLAQLRQERDGLLAQLAQVTTQIASLESAGILEGGGEVLFPARVPTSPVSPQPLHNTVLALVLGLVLGVCVAFVMDALDDAIRSSEDVKRAIGRPILGFIPEWKGMESEGRVVTLVEQWSPPSEAYRTLRTNVRFLTGVRAEPNDGEGHASVVVTSASNGEGKTTTAANLAVAAAQAGSRVILVDADLRRPDLHRLFGQPQGQGLAEILVGDLSLTDALLDIDIPNLRLLRSGSVPPNPAELLASPRMTNLAQRLANIADLVVFDTPPVLTVADALELAQFATCSLVVVNAGRSHRRALRAVEERLTGVQAHIAGCVMNRIGDKDGYYSYYSYYGYYGRQSYEPATTNGDPSTGAAGHAQVKRSSS